MMELLNNTYIKASLMKNFLKERAHKFIQEEKGGAEIIAVIVLIAIVIVLAIAFRGKIAELVSTIWRSITTNSGKVSETMTISG